MAPDHLADIALFVEVVKARSFSRAAEVLEMPASTLSRRIAALERAVGLRLLARTTRRVDTTEAGAAYFARCAPLVEEARNAHEQLAADTAQARGTLRLACTPDFATLYLAPLLVDFTRRHTGVSVQLLLGQEAIDLDAERVDAALRFGPLPDSTLVARPLALLQAGLYAAPDYLVRAEPVQVPADLARHACVLLRGPTVWRLRRVDAASADGPADGPADTGTEVAVQGRLAAGSMTMVRELTLRGCGIGMVDRAMARPEVQAGRLVELLPAWRPAPVPLSLLTPSRLMPARVRLFGDHLAAHLGVRLSTDQDTDQGADRYALSPKDIAAP